MPWDLAELAARQLTETGMCMEPDVLVGLEQMSRLFLGNSVCFNFKEDLKRIAQLWDHLKSVNGLERSPPPCMLKGPLLQKPNI